MAYNTKDLKRVAGDLSPEWHIPIYADGNQIEFMRELSAALVASYGVRVSDAMHVYYPDYTVMRASSDDEGKIKAVCTSLRARGARFGKDCDGLAYAIFTNGEFGDLF